MPPSSAGGDGGESAATEPDAGSDDAAPDAALVYDGGPFACGTMTCAVDQYCTDHSIVFPGIDAAGPPDTYFCLPMYVACQQDPTCACITSSIASGNPCSPAVARRVVHERRCGPRDGPLHGALTARGVAGGSGRRRRAWEL